MLVVIVVTVAIWNKHNVFCAYLSLSLSISVYLVPTPTQVHHHQECCLHFRTDGLVLNTLVKSTWASYASRGLTFLLRMHKAAQKSTELRIFNLQHFPLPRRGSHPLSSLSPFIAQVGRETVISGYLRQPVLEILPWILSHRSSSLLYICAVIKYLSIFVSGRKMYQFFEKKIQTSIFLGHFSGSTCKALSHEHARCYPWDNRNKV